MQGLIQTENDVEVKYKQDIIDGLIHSLLVMIDGGDQLAVHFIVDLIDVETKQSLKDVALHEGYTEYLINNE